MAGTRRRKMRRNSLFLLDFYFGFFTAKIGIFTGKTDE